MKTSTRQSQRCFPLRRNSSRRRILSRPALQPAPAGRKKFDRRRWRHSSASQEDDLQIRSPWSERKEEYLCDVRATFVTSWFVVELIGTLTGKDAENAARIAVFQEYYRRRATAQLCLVEELRARYAGIPIKEENMEKVVELRNKKIPNAVTRVFVLLEDWLVICIYAIGVIETRRIVAETIDEVYADVTKTLFNKELPLGRQTRSVCIDELWSKINLIDQKKQSSNNHHAGERSHTSGEEDERQHRAIDISLALREKFHDACLQALIDAATSYAETEFEPKEMNEYAVGGSRVSPGDSGAYTARYSLRAHGSAIAKLREQIRSGENITRFVEGAKDPFENVPESAIFKHCARLCDRILVIPKPKYVWFGLKDETIEPTSEEDCEETENEVKYEGFFSSVTQAANKENSVWDSLPLSEQQLNAFLLGMSEYLCDDFGIKGAKNYKKMILFPTDMPLRLGWLPNQTVLQLDGLKDSHELILSSQMMKDLISVCDFLLENVTDLVAMAPPLPSYVVREQELRSKKKTAFVQASIVSLLIFTGLLLGMTRSEETKQRWKNFIREKQTAIAEIIKKKNPKQ